MLLFVADSLFLILLSSAMSVSAQEAETIYSWESPSGTVTETGGIHDAGNVIWKRMKQSGNFGRNIEFRLQEKSLRQRLTRLLFYLHWFKDGMKISPNLTFRLIQSKKLG